MVTGVVGTLTGTLSQGQASGLVTLLDPLKDLLGSLSPRPQQAAARGDERDFRHGENAVQRDECDKND